MSKHLRNQRRPVQTNTQMTAEHSALETENKTVTHEAFVAASELVHDDLNDAKLGNTELVQTEQEEKAESGNLGNEDYVDHADLAEASLKENVDSAYSITATEQEENMQNNAPSVPYISEEHPNGDDPDRVPVIPELADDQVPNMPGAILKHAREMLGLSLRDVSNRLNLRVNTVSDIEHDRLNQPTASNFVIPHITSYAKLVNIDPHTLVELYMNNVREVMQEAGKRAAVIQRQERRERHRGLKIALLSAGALALIVLGIGIGAYMASSPSSEEDASGALTLSPGAQVQQQMTGAGEDPFPQEQSADEQAEEQIDPNTQMAREQAEALGTNDIIEYAQKGVDEEKDGAKEPQESLSLLPANAKTADAKAEIAPTHDIGVANAKNSSSSAQLQNNAQQNNAQQNKPAQNAALTLPKDSSQNVASAPSVAQAPLPVAVPVSSKTQARDNKVTSSVAANNKTAQSDRASQKKTSSSQDGVATLPATVRDISSLVRIVNRNDIGSLNTVEVQIKAPVAMRIKGANKVLKSGSFKSGEKISATGMPPLRIEVSDTSKITVKYNGGTAVVPAERNVGYDLPVR